MTEHNCLQQCHDKLNLALNEKEQEVMVQPNPTPAKVDPPEPELASVELQPVTAPSEQDFPQAQNRSVDQNFEWLKSYRLTRNDKKKVWVALYAHIARNLSLGVYKLEPLKEGQCATCRHVIGSITQTARHQENCRYDMYTVGCPCGLLFKSTRSIGGHRASCRIASDIFRSGVEGWLPYINPAWRRFWLLTQTQ